MDGRQRGPGAPIPPTAVFVVGFLLAWGLHVALPSPIERDELSSVQHTVGTLMVLLGAVLFLWGLRTFAVVRTGIMLQKPALTLVGSGPYRWSRNPMYVGFTAIYIGAALIANTVWPLVVLPLVIVTVAVGVIAREERYLRHTFGPAYDEYCQRVGRWL